MNRSHRSILCLVASVTLSCGSATLKMDSGAGGSQTDGGRDLAAGTGGSAGGGGRGGAATGTAGIGGGGNGGVGGGAGTGGSAGAIGGGAGDARGGAGGTAGGAGGTGGAIGGRGGTGATGGSTPGTGGALGGRGGTGGSAGATGGSAAGTGGAVAGRGGTGGATGAGGTGGNVPAGLGALCGAGTDCQSTFCIDGVCCNAACNLSCQGCSMATTGVSSGTCAIRTTASAGTQVCGGACVNTQMSAAHCNMCNRACQGTTPKCASGTCVECTAQGDCTGTGTTCTAQSTCRCGVGFHACGPSTSPCFSDADVTHCGTGCTNCSQPNANAACGAGDNCANTCKQAAYTLSCPAVGGKPNCSHWDFESSVIADEGWALHVPSGTTTAAVGGLMRSSLQPLTGSSSLAITYNNQGDTSRYVEVRVKLCAGNNVLDLRSKSIHWGFRMDPPQSGGYNFLVVYDAPAFGEAGGLFDFNTNTDTAWRHFDQSLSSLVFGQVFGIGFHLQATQSYNGTIYLDDIRIY